MELLKPDVKQPCLLCFEKIDIEPSFSITPSKTGFICTRPNCKATICYVCTTQLYPLVCPVCKEEWVIQDYPPEFTQFLISTKKARDELSQDVDSKDTAIQILEEDLRQLKEMVERQHFILMNLTRMLRRDMEGRHGLPQNQQFNVIPVYNPPGIRDIE